MREKIRKQYGFKPKTTLRGTVSYTPHNAMQKLSLQKLQEEEKIHEKAKKANKNPYKYSKEVKEQKIKNQEKRAEMRAKTKGL